MHHPLPTLIERHGETVEVTASGKKLTFAAKAEPALSVLLSGAPVRLDAATVTAGSEVSVVAGILVKEELCAVLTPELSSGYTGLVTSGAS